MRYQEVLCTSWYLIQQAGYAYSFHLYNAANFGSFQIRERVVIICSRDGKRPPFLTPTHSENGKYGLPKWKPFRDATADLTSHTHINFPEKRLKFYRMLSEGQNWRSLPEALQKHWIMRTMLVVEKQDF